MSLVVALLGALRASLKTRTDLALENLALRQQLVLLRRRSKRPQFGRLERLLWVWLSHQWAGWREALHVVRPQTVIRWHRQGFRAFWTWNSRRGRVGRPPVSSELAELVRTMALANPLWGSPRIHGELLKLGFEVSQRTVARLMPRRPKRPSQTWRTFLKNHIADLVSVDFSSPCPSSVVSTTATSAARRSRSGSRPCRHISRKRAIDLATHRCGCSAGRSARSSIIGGAERATRGH